MNKSLSVEIVEILVSDFSVQGTICGLLVDITVNKCSTAFFLIFPEIIPELKPSVWPSDLFLLLDSH